MLVWVLERCHISSMSVADAYLLCNLPCSLLVLLLSLMLQISPAGMTAMATTGSIGVLLPTTAYGLRIPPPPVRAMIDAGLLDCCCCCCHEAEH